MSGYIITKQTQRNDDLTFLHFILSETKKILFIIHSDHLPAFTNPYRGSQKSDPNVNSVYRHHYFVDTHGLFFDE